MLKRPANVTAESMIIYSEKVNHDSNKYLLYYCVSRGELGYLKNSKLHSSSKAPIILIVEEYKSHQLD
jgi:hypothetical protein